MQRFGMVAQRAILATAVLVALHPPPARGQCEVQKLTVAGSELVDYFGAGAAVSGDWAVVGAPGAGFLSRGIAYVYRRHGVTWVEEAHFSPPEIHTNSDFGSTVAIMGDVAAVGSPSGTSVGGEPVRIYRRTNGGTPDDPADDTWCEQAELLPSDPGLTSAYGSAISIDGEHVIIGDPIAGPSPAGAVYIFRRDENNTPNDPTDDTWVEEAKLASPAKSPCSNFGNAVALNGALLLVGNLVEECEDGPGCGAAYVYRRDDKGTPSDPDDDEWILEARLTPRDQLLAQFFGSSVDLADGIAIIGAASLSLYPGAVYVFEKIDGNWVETNKLLASDGDVVDRFGESIWVGDSLIMVGAPKLDGHGAAYLFRKIDDAWVEEVKFLATDPAMGDDFGETISVSGQWGLVSVAGDQDGGNGDSACTFGSAYFFAIAGDCNENDSPDLCDILDGSSEDVDGNGVPDECGCAANAECVDGNPCTVDACVDTVCTHQPVPDGTTGLCAGAGPCAEDVCIGSQCAPTPIGTPCPDGFFCNGVETCDGGGVCLPAVNATCLPSDICDESNDGCTDRPCGVTKLLAPGGGMPGERYGEEVAVAGDVLVIGAPSNNASCPLDPLCFAGIAYVYVRDDANTPGDPDDDTWNLSAVLDATPPCGGELFGKSVATDGEWVAVANSRDSDAGHLAGSIYIYLRNSNGTPDQPADDLWEFKTKLFADKPSAFGLSSHAMAMFGSALLVGSPFAGGDGGGWVHVFRRNDNGTPDDPSDDVWSPESKLEADDGAAGDRFGDGIAMYGDVAVIGASFDDGADGALNVGSVYVFRHDGQSFVQEAKLAAPNGDEHEQFGWHVSIHGDVIAVGAPLDDDLGNNYGATYIFRWSGSSWEFEAKLTASDGNESGSFGRSVAIGPDMLLVGASGANGPAEDTGAVYAFTFDGQEWSEIRKVTAPDATENDFFATVMAASGTTVVVGATGDDDACEFDQNCGSGSAYVFTIGGIDCNENTVPDVCDIIDGDSIDANGNGIPDECESAIAIIAADPPHGAIDARQPFLPDGSNPAGWDSVAITFDADASSLSVEDFAITVTSGSPPSIIDVIPAGDTVTLVLDMIITPGAWTIFTHVPSDTYTALGSLPGDVGGDCVSLPSDILTLIDALNGAIDSLPIWSADVDRSGIANAIDILRVIDLLNGANLYDNWLGVELCPDGCPELGCP